MDSKYKILILQGEISGYNVETYNIIAETYNLTVGYYRKDKSNIRCKFQKHRFDFKSFGSFTFIKGLRSFCKQYDLVCILPDFHVISYCILPFLPHSYKISNWSIGFRVSYQHPYITDRKHNFLDHIFRRILDRCDSSIFYMEKSKEFWKNTSVDLRKIYVAPNTTSVVDIEIKPEMKRDFIFVGTLYKGKGLDLLLNSYKQLLEEVSVNVKLRIVGDGEMRAEIETFIKKNHLEGRIYLLGAIYDEILLAKEFSKAVLCFSPTQGGLSVPKSMGYAVPFVTKKNAITGGEIYHMTPGVNGIMYDRDEELITIMLDAVNNASKYIEMGMRAKDYYNNYATVKHMAQGAMDAFKFALK